MGWPVITNTQLYCTIQAKYITEAEEKYNQVLKALDPQLSLHYQRRCVEATKEGNSATINFYSRWNLILFSLRLDVSGIWNF